MILRLYGEARVVHPRDAEWDSLLAHFDVLADAGARQIFVLKVSLAQTSCGMGVPLFDYHGQRTQLVEWSERKGPAGIAEYWQMKNQLTIDGKPTGIFGEEELAD